MNRTRTEDYIFGVGETLWSCSDHVETHTYNIPNSDLKINFTDTVGYGDNRGNMTTLNAFA